MAEVEIYEGSKNVARTGKVSQSSTGFNGPPKLAIDGNTDGDYAKMSVTHTNQEDNPWLEIDLGSPRKVNLIKIYNRTDGGTANRIKEFQIVAFDEKREPNWVQRVKKTPNPDHVASVPVSFESFSPEQTIAIAQYKTEADPKELTIAQKKLKDLQSRLNGIKGPTVPIFRELPRTREGILLCIFGVPILATAIKCMQVFRLHCLMLPKEYLHQIVWTLPNGLWIQIIRSHHG